MKLRGEIAEKGAEVEVKSIPNAKEKKRMIKVIRQVMNEDGTVTEEDVIYQSKKFTEVDKSEDKEDDKE